MQHAPAFAASTVVLVNQDDPGEGLNDPTLFVPEGGNSAATLGEARQRVLEFAAAMWAESLETEIPIRIGVRFDPLGGLPYSAFLGSAGAAEVYRDFAGAPQAGVWYPSALADRLAGLDLSAGSEVDVTALFNSDVDGDEVLGSTTFYYGFNRDAGEDVDLLTTVLHEFAHGVGMTTYVDVTTGQKLFGFDDAYTLQLEQHGASPELLSEMTNAERLVAITSGSDLHWIGAYAGAESARLTAGATPEGHIQMYAPPFPMPGGSLDHFALALSPDELLEPFYGAADLDLCLTVALLGDVGWGPPPPCQLGVVIGEGGGGINLPPTVVLTSPLDGAVFTEGDTIDLAATASDSDGSVTEVEFFEDGNSLGTVQAAPYVWAWPDAPVGDHDLTAVARDDDGAQATSAVIHVTIEAAPPANLPPTVSLTSPLDGAVFTEGDTIDLAATASDSDGTIDEVEFFEDGNSLGTVQAAPYTLVWTGAPIGAHDLTAIARDDDGAQTVSTAVQVTVGAAIPETVYEDAEDGLTLGWVVLIDDPPGATIANVDDIDQGKVIELTGSGTDNLFVLSNEDGTRFGNTSEFVGSWAMNFSESALLGWRVVVNNGVDCYVMYSDLFAPGCVVNQTGNAAFCGLDVSHFDGAWHVVTQDVAADLAAASPGIVVTSVSNFAVKGSGRVDNIKLLESLP